MTEKERVPRLKKVVKYRVRIEVLTGMRIGGYSDVARIGGVDLVVAKTPQEVDGNFRMLPYIPGSSLKGKLRSLLELKEGHIGRDGETKSKKECEDKECPICKLFGRAGDVIQPDNESLYSLSRLVFRDLYPTKDTIKTWNELEERGVLYEGVEIKAENTLNRYTARANPRQLERVPPGSVFEGELVMRIVMGDDENALEKKLKEAINLLNNDYLGGHGTRGYGRVKVVLESPEVVYSPSE